MRSSAKQLSRGSTCWSMAASTTACWWRTTAPTEWCLRSRGQRSRHDVPRDAFLLGSPSQVFQIAEDAQSIGREGRVMSHRRAPNLLGCKRVRQVKQPAIGGVNDVLPVATPGRTLDSEAANGLPANACTTRLRGL